jgi:hypothetical protein
MIEDWGMMIESGEVRQEGCICKPCSDILTNWIGYAK